MKEGCNQTMMKRELKEEEIETRVRGKVEEKTP